MQFLEMHNQLKEFTVFSLADIRAVDSHFHRRRLNDWQDKGYIKKIIRGFYIFSDTKLAEPALFEMANKIYAPSYVSFEMALSYYGLIPEGVYGITSAATRKTSRFKTAVAEFSYHTLKPRLFFGYRLVTHNDKHFKIASPQKALLDYLYLHPSIENVQDFESLRLNKPVFFERVQKESFAEALSRFSQERLTKRAEALWRHMKNA